MKKNRILLILSMFLLIACNWQKQDDRTRIGSSDYLEAFDKVSREIIGMQFKELEAKSAALLFDEFKNQKLIVVRRVFGSQDSISDRKKLAEIKMHFDETILDKTMLGDVRSGVKENKYVAEFENQCAKRFIIALGDESKFPANKLKIIYDNKVP